jgi:hypothetical protein
MYHVNNRFLTMMRCWGRCSSGGPWRQTSGLASTVRKTAIFLVRVNLFYPTAVTLIECPDVEHSFDSISCSKRTHPSRRWWTTATITGSLREEVKVVVSLLVRLVQSSFAMFPRNWCAPAWRKESGASDLGKKEHKLGVKFSLVALLLLHK